MRHVINNAVVYDHFCDISKGLGAFSFANVHLNLSSIVPMRFTRHDMVNNRNVSRTTILLHA